MTGFLYVICGRRDGEAVGPCKVGRSYKPEGRLKTLQTSSPHKLEVFEVWDFPNRHMARDAERMAHAALREFRLSGEWFDLPPADVVSRLTIWFYWAADAAGKMARNPELLPFGPPRGVGMVANGRADSRGRLL